jgi:uncharacterized protein
MIPAECLDNRRLHLVLMPTEACQFRCTYCYEDFALGRMPPAVVRGLKTWLERRAPELELLQLSWFGGEPLLALDLLLDVQAHALELARRHPPLAVRANLTTNGHRLEVELFRRLLALAVTEYQITLDGPQEAHDRTRKLAGGGATFERIWTNLLALHALAESFSVLLRVHVHRGNLETLPVLLERCAAAWGSDPRFRLSFKALFHPGRSGFDAATLLAPEEQAEALGSLHARAAALGLAERPLPGSGAGAEEAICYASKANSFVVRSDGRLNKCSVALSSSENQVGRLNEDGTVAIDAVRMQHWMRGLFSGDAEERRCPMLRKPEPIGAEAG